MAARTYPYSPLDLGKLAVRLLRIQRGWGIDDIICKLFESYPDPEKGVPYKALSYNWGGVQHIPRLGVPRALVDGHEIDMTENLHSALRHIRRHDQDVILWVDAICINQQDPREKGHQVKQMGEVYMNAQEVIVWLGPSNNDIDHLLSSIRWIDKKTNEAQARELESKTDWTTLCRQFLSQSLSDLKPEDLPRLKQALAELLARPWFKRVWILQEVANARTARILCGTVSCPARTFALMPSLVGLDVDEHTQAVLDIMPRFRRNTWWSSTRSLHFLLGKFSKSQAHHARDKIYALLGMSEDACSPGVFYPCYEKSSAEVIRDTASFLLFGEILDKSYRFLYSWSPVRCNDYLSIPSQYLRRPTAQLAARALKWFLQEEEDPQRRQASRRSTELLVRRMNEGRIETAAVLLYFAEMHGTGDRARAMLDREGVEVRIEMACEPDSSRMCLVFTCHCGSPVSGLPARDGVPARITCSAEQPFKVVEAGMDIGLVEPEGAGS